MMRKYRSFLKLVVMIAASGIGWAVPAQEQQVNSRTLETEAIAAYKTKNFPVFLDRIKRAESLRPNHPRLLYNLAAAYALNDKAGEALDTLKQLARMGLVFPVSEDEDFAVLRSTPEFAAVAGLFRANKAPIVKSKPAFTIAEKGIVPESVALDARTGSFYVSSVAKRKILKVEKNGRHTVFADAADGLWSVLGIKIDAKRRLLWAAVSALKQTPDLEKDEVGNAALVKFDLQSGRLVKKYVLPNQAKRHVLGDLALHPNGDVYVTDSASPAVYVVRSDRDMIEPFLEGAPFVSLQGLDFSSDGSALFVADYSSGIFKIDLAAKTVTTVAASKDSTSLGIDGLYVYRDSLIGIQNGVNPQRVVRMFLSKDGGRIERFDILEANNPVFDEPTLGVLRADEFYFVANSQWNLLGDKGQMKTPEKLKDVEILRIDLR